MQKIVPRLVRLFPPTRSAPIAFLQQYFHTKENPTDSLSLAPMSFSNVLSRKLPPSKINRFQRLWNDSEGKNSFLPQLVLQGELRDVLDLVEKNVDKMDTMSLVAAQDVIFVLLKDEKSGVSKKELLNSVGMQKMMQLIRRKSRGMDSGDLISTLKMLLYLGISGSDPTLQIALKVLSKQVNGIFPDQLIYLHFLLEKIPEEAKSPLSTALCLALPVVFSSQIASSASSGQLNTEKVQELCDYLHYSTKYGMDDRTIRPIVEAMENKMGHLSAKNAISVLWSLGDARNNEMYQEPLVSACFKIVTENIDAYDVNVLSTVLGKATRKYCRKIQFFYNEDFVSSFCTRLMSRHRDVTDHAMFSFKSISLLRHVHVEYMDRIGEIVASKPSEVLNNDILFLNVVRAFSSCNYKPDSWYKFEAILLNHPALTKDLGMQEIQLAIDFLALESYPETLIERIFSAEELPRLDNFLQRSPMNTASTLLLLLNAVQLLYPNYSGSLPPTSMINKWMELVKEDVGRRGKHIQIKAALEKGLGGENYLLNGMFHHGIAIDHAIVMRKGGYPIAMNLPDNKELSEIRKPPESEIVLVRVFAKEAYANNTPRLRGIMALEQRVIEALGHPAVFVDGQRWMQLADREKIPYLMQKIREKVDKLQWNQSGSDVIPR